MSGAFPVFRFELQDAKQLIHIALNDRHQDLVAAAIAGIDAAITEIPARLAADARRISIEIMEEALREAIKNYWESGPGRAKLQEMIEQKLA